MYYLDTIA